jgi:hypothetical protein
LPLGAARNLEQWESYRAEERINAQERRIKANVRHSRLIAPESFPKNERRRPLLQRGRQAPDFRRIFGAGEGVRTLDPDLGKVVLYH